MIGIEMIYRMFFSSEKESCFLDYHCFLLETSIVFVDINHEEIILLWKK